MDHPPVRTQAALPLGGPRSWWGRRVRGVPLLAVLFFAVFAFLFLRRGRDSDWHQCYVPAALRLARGEVIHRVEPGAYAYPPAPAMFCVPLARLPPPASLLGWYLVNVLATSVVFVCAWRLMGGPSLVELPGRWRAVFWLGAFLSLRFIDAPLETHQFDIVIAALALLGCLRIWQGRDLAGAAWLGASAAMKCTPLLFAPYLLWRGKTKAACLLVLVAVALNRLPDWLWPQAAGGLYLADWMHSFLGQVARSAPGVWFSTLVLNQSLAGMFNRLAQAGLPLSVADLPSAEVVLPATTTVWLRVVVYGTGVLVVAWTAWRFGAAGRPAPAVGRGRAGPVAWEKLRTPIEASAVLCLMLLLSPMTSKAHFVVLVLPCLLVARAAVERMVSWPRWLLVPLAITGPLTSKGLIGKPLGDLTLAWGLPTWFVLLSLVAMWRLLRAAQGGAVAEVQRPAAPHVAGWKATVPQG